MIKKLHFFYICFCLLFLSFSAWSQTTLFTANFGTTTTFPTGWTAGGTGSPTFTLLTNNVSTGLYTGASGGSNVYLRNDVLGLKTLTYDNSLSTVGYTNITVMFGLRKTNVLAPVFSFSWSSDGTTWNPVAYTDVDPASIWYLANDSVRIVLPAGAEGVANLRLRWEYDVLAVNAWSTRMDDVTVRGDCMAPTTQATSFSTNTITTTTMNYAFTRGDGTGGVMVVAKAGSAPTDPTPGTTYTANAAYGSGNACGGGFVVYNGAAAGINNATGNIAITGLTANTTYHFAVYEYTSGSPCYFPTELTGSAATLCISPTTQASSFTVPTNVSGTGINIAFTRGNGTGGVMVVAKAGSAPSDPTSGSSYTANSVYGSGSACGGGYVVYNGTAAGVGLATGNLPVTGLTGSTTYYFAVYEYQVTTNCYHLTELTGSVTTPCARPSTQAASCCGTNTITANSMNMSFTRGNGTGGVLIVLKQGSAVTGDPAPGTTYTANSSYGLGDACGDGYVVYNGAANGVSVASGNIPLTGLLPSTSYYCAIYEYNTTDVCYHLDQATNVGPFTTSACSAPATQATVFSTNTITDLTMNYAFTRGNGTGGVMVIAKAGSAPADPTRGLAYTANSVYGSGDAAGGGFVVYNGPANGVSAATGDIAITGLTANTTYYFAVYEYNTTNYCYNINQLAGSATTLCTPPSTQASSFSTNTIATTSMNYAFTRGNGDGGVLVVARAGSAPTDPVSGTAYTASATYGSGTACGGGFVVYNGTAAGINNATGNIAITGLTAFTTYHFAVYEYTSSGTCFNLTELTGSATTLCAPPTTQATTFTTNTITGTTMNFAFTRGNGTAGVMVVAKAGSAPSDPTSGTAYTANAAYGSGDACGGGFVVYKGTAAGASLATGNLPITGLSGATTYYFAVYEYNTTGTCYHLTELSGSATTLCAPPSTQASGFGTNTITPVSMNVTFTRGNGSNVMVVAKQGSPPSDPSQSTSYSANSVYGSGDACGGGYVIYNGPANGPGVASGNIAMSGLLHGNLYYFAIYEYENTNTCYHLGQLTGNATTTTCTAPSQAASFTTNTVTDVTMNYAFTRGTGTGGVLVIARAGSAPGDPTRGVAYTANSTYGSGTAVGSGFAVYNGTAAGASNATGNIAISGLTGNTTYHFAAFEYDATTLCYNLIQLTGSATTLCTPAVTQASSFSTNTVTSTTMNYAFTRGDGDGGVMVVAKAGSAPTDPTVGTTYTANATYGSGNPCGGGFVVYNGAASGINNASGNIAITGLTASTTYHFAVYEYNSSGACYNLTELTGNATTLCAPPGTQANTFSTNTITSASMNYAFTRGNGNGGVLVVAKAGSAPSDPTSGTTYTANAAYGSGDACGGGFVVYNGVANGVSAATGNIAVTGLSGSTTYHFAVYEYTSSGTCFNLSELTGNATTLCTPPSTQATGFSTNSITSTSMNYAFTRGNGSNVLVIARANSAVVTDPTNGNSYTANATFGSGNAIGSGYVVYNGPAAGASIATGDIAITGLTASTTYHFAAYEYESTYNCYHQIQLAGSATTLCTSPGTQASAFSTNTITATTMNYAFTRGNGSGGVLVVAKAGSAPSDPTSGTTYTANAAYGSGDACGGGFVIYKGTAAGVGNATGNIAVTGLSPFTTYYYAVYEYQTSGTCFNLTELTGSATTLCSPPSTQASSFSTNSITGSTMNYAFTRGNGTGGVLVVAKAGSAPTDPSVGTTYAANPAYGSGDACGGGFVVYNGAASGVSVGSGNIAITGLSGLTTYHFAVYEYTAAGACYHLTELTGSATTTCTSPSVQASAFATNTIATNSMNYNFTRGNGSGGVLVVAKAGSAPSDPSSGTTYTANSNYGSGDACGGGFVIYNGVAAGVSAATGDILVLGLSSATTYYFAVYEYETTNTCYNLTELSGSATTDCIPPFNSASTFGTSAITSTTMNYSFTRGDGTGGVMVVAKAGSAPTDPTNGTTYTASATYGSGNACGGGFVVYNGSAAGINLASGDIAISGLSASTTYHFAVYEYETAGVCYNLTELTGNATTLCSSPSTQASSFSTNTITQTSMNYAFTRGNGSGGVLVVAKAGSAPSDPTTGTTYSASTTYGSGDACGGGFVVYNGVASGVSAATGNIAVSGLSTGTTYYFAVYEYATAGTCYNLTELTGTATTLCNAPSTQATSFSTNTITSSSMNYSFTRGNGTGGVLVIARAGSAPSDPTAGTVYAASSTYGSGDVCGGGYVIYNGTASGVSIGTGNIAVTGLISTTTYYFAVYEYEAAGTCYHLTELTGNATTSACVPPATQATSFSSNTITNTTMNYAFTRGNGSNVLVVVKAGSAPSDPTNGVSYTASVIYGSGTVCGGGYVVYNGAASGVSVATGNLALSGLTASTTYYFAIYEYAATDVCYNMTELTGSATTISSGAAALLGTAGMNSSGAAGSPSAVLDIDVPDKGILVPQVALTGTTDATTISSPATSLLVYNSATVSDVTPGYYFWDGTIWSRLLNSNPSAANWDLVGNSGTTLGTNFAGTTDNINLTFRINNTEAMRVKAHTLEFLNNSDGLYLGEGAAINHRTNFSYKTLAIGYNALFSVTSSGVVDNLAIGKNALRSATSTNTSFAIGNNCLYNNNSSSIVTFGMGAYTMYNLTTGSSFGIGDSALYNSTSKSSDCVIGMGALLSGNGIAVAIGRGAMRNSSAPGAFSLGNVGIGLNALYNSTAADNVAIGNYAGLLNTTAQSNTAIGFEAGYTANAGSNTFVGVGAGRSNTGSGNVFIGYNAGYNETGSNKLYIDNSNTATPLIYADFSGANVGINRKPTANIFEISGAASMTTAGAWATNSDKRIKTNIKEIEGAIATIMKLHPVKFKYTEEWKSRNPYLKANDHYYYNFIAQEYQTVFPESVTGSGEYLQGDSTEILQVDTYNSQIVAIAAIKEQQKLIEQQKNILFNQKKLVAAQRRKMYEQQAKIEELRKRIVEIQQQEK